MTIAPSHGRRARRRKICSPSWSIFRKPWINSRVSSNFLPFDIETKRHHQKLRASRKTSYFNVYENGGGLNDALVQSKRKDALTHIAAILDITTIQDELASELNKPAQKEKAEATQIIHDYIESTKAANA